MSLEGRARERYAAALAHVIAYRTAVGPVEPPTAEELAEQLAWHGGATYIVDRSGLTLVRRPIPGRPHVPELDDLRLGLLPDTTARRARALAGR